MVYSVSWSLRVTGEVGGGIAEDQAGTKAADTRFEGRAVSA